MTMVAVVTGFAGTVGSVFTKRLQRDSFPVIAVGRDSPHEEIVASADTTTWLFHCAFDPEDLATHVQETHDQLAQWESYSAIFLPLPQTGFLVSQRNFCLAKLAILALVEFYEGLGAAIVTDSLLDLKSNPEVAYERVLRRMREPRA